jgi:mono/diheme cytochrome c family protein
MYFFAFRSPELRQFPGRLSIPTEFLVGTTRDVMIVMTSRPAARVLFALPCLYPLKAMKHLIAVLLLILMLAMTPSAHAAGPVDFGREIQPILAEHCFQCHGKDEQTRQGGLRLDLRETALKGGESEGPAIVPGKPEVSGMIVRLTTKDPDQSMPPPQEKKPLKPAELEKIRRWIAEGAPYAQHWAFIPPVKTELPKPNRPVSDHPIDTFVASQLEQHGLTLSPETSSDILGRRIYLDVIGLPPSPQQLDLFAQECRSQGSATATRSLVDRLLQSQNYGEKWARPWLDAARYADSNGFEKDVPREQWAWRDWVIQALNRDLPYDQFVIEQIAGDLLPNPTQAQVIATGFLRNGMINEEGAIIPEQFRMDGIFDRIDAIGKSVLGLSLQCAQCHSHKFDPITHDEYYGVFAFLNDTYEAQSWVYSAAQQKKIDEVRAGIAAVENRLKEQTPAWSQKLAAWEAEQRKRLDQISWQIIDATDLDSSTGLNHPTKLADKSVLTLGHRTTKGDVVITAEPNIAGATGIRLEALRYGDLPFAGPGRSYKGTWALTELIVETQQPGSDIWKRQKLNNATADFSEPEHEIEPEWTHKGLDKENSRRKVGPVAFLVDGKDETGWRADRGVGVRNTDSVAVVQFEKPLDLPAGAKLKISLRENHGGDDNGGKNTMVGRFRLALTTTADPKVNATPYAAVLATETPIAKRTPKEQADIFAAWRMSEPEFKPFNDEIAALWKQFPEAETSVLHLAQRGPQDTRDTFRLDRGAWDRPKERIAPHVPVALHGLPKDASPDRLAFAHWLADKRSPLTARMAVNRVWQVVFGTGLVETSEDFGTRVEVPEYRELLDWLAVDFMEHGWSQKHLIRTIVTCAAYRQTSRATPQLLEQDPRNRLLARGPRFRADAEAIRDIALTVSGLLTSKVGGPSVFPPVPESVLNNNFTKPDYWKIAEGPERYRRSLYIFRRRSMPDPVLTTFDAPNADLACARRPRSNTPLAALVSLNEPIFVESARALALRVLREGAKTDAERADYAFRLCTGRVAKSAEREEILALIKDRRQRLADGWLSMRDITTGDATKLPELPRGATPQDAAVWTIVARVLLNLDETLCKN